MVQTRMPEKVKTVGVIGAGQMGSGIAQVMAHHGEFHVLLQDVYPQQLEKARSAIENSLERFVKKAMLDDVGKHTVLTRIDMVAQIDALKDADIVIEAIIEDEALKKNLFQALDELMKPEAILASNTSSISITRLAAVTKRPGQVIGLHFMNPVPMMPLIEIIRGAQTSEETYRTVDELGKKLGKTTVMSHDYPGFISNRILMPMINEAIFALFEGVGSAEDIDTVMKLGMNHPMGPLQLADFIGLDTCLSILNVLYEGFKDPKYRPCPLLVQKVHAGYLGKKVGQGFYSYPP